MQKGNNYESNGLVIELTSNQGEIHTNELKSILKHS